MLTLSIINKYQNPNNMEQTQKTQRLKPGRFVDQEHNLKVKMLTWKQPYGYLMLKDKLESRTRDTHYRGWVLLHAAKQDYKSSQVLRISGANHFAKINEITSHVGHSIYMSRGKAFAIGYLDRTKPMQNATETEKELSFVSYNPDLYLLHFSEVHPIKPFAMQGKLGWHNCDRETIEKIEIVETFMDKQNKSCGNSCDWPKCTLDGCMEKANTAKDWF